MRKHVFLPVIAAISVWAHAQVISLAPALVSAEGSQFSPDIAEYQQSQQLTCYYSPSLVPEGNEYCGSVD